MFSLFILSRILFAACMIFVLGYIFGNFSKTKTLTVISKIASVLLIVLFIFSSSMSARFGRWDGQGRRPHQNCESVAQDSTDLK